MKVTCNDITTAVTVGGFQSTGTAVRALPVGVVSFTVSGDTGTFDVSFDGGATWPLTNRSGTRTWGWSGAAAVANGADVRVRGNAAGSTYDVIYEVHA